MTESVAWTVLVRVFRVMALLVAFLWYLPANAATYTNVTNTFSWINPATHTKVGYNTAPYKLNTCGTTPPILDDTISNLIPIGFNFLYGATSYNSLKIETNGRLQFANSNCGAGTSSIGPPQTYTYLYPVATMNNTMKAFGVDLDPTNLVDKPNYPSAANKTSCTSSATCYISYASLGTAPNRQFVVTWKNVPEWVNASNTSGSFDFQIILNEDGTFVYQYLNIVHGGTGSAQIGWQLSTADYSVLTFGASSEPPPNTAILFYVPSANPLAEYRFEEGAWSSGGAGQVADSSASVPSRPGTAIGSVQENSAGIIKVCRNASIPNNTTAAIVDAIKTGVKLSDVGVNMSGQGTVMLWYKSNLAWSGAGAQAAQLIDATQTSGQWFSLTKTATGTLFFEVTDSAGVVRSVETAAQAFAAGTWVHVAVSWNFNALPAANSDHLQIFINGAAPTTSSFSSAGNVTTTLDYVHVGDNPSGLTGTKGSVNSANGTIDELRLYNFEMNQGQVLGASSQTHTCPTFFIDHLELQHGTWSGVTCSPGTLTVVACANAACSTLYTSGLVATLSATGAATVWDPATGGSTIVIGAGQSSATKSFNTAIGTAKFSVAGTGVPVVVTNPSNNKCNGAGTCIWTSADSGFLFSVPDHVAETSQSVTVSAVKKSDNSLVCIPAFASVSKSLTFTCVYGNPGTGTLPVRVGGTALNAAGSVATACDAGGKAVSLNFDASGVATTTVQYADVGNMTLNATHTTAGGVVMTGSDGFIAAPASFTFSSITAAPIKAGANFSATVTAMNAAATPAATPNFGKESTPPEGVTLTRVKCQPTGTNAVNGALSGGVGSFSNGTASASNLVWSEVGNIDLIATLASGSYLGSGLSATGNTGSTGSTCSGSGGAGTVGRFIPHHFDTLVTQGCSAGVFTYSGQPFLVTVTAKNGLASPTTTVNYDGTANTLPNFAKAVTLSDANGATVGALSNTAVAAALFAQGVATTPSPPTTSSPIYTFTSRQTVPTTIKLRAVETSPGGDGVSSSGFTEGTTTVRSGRARLLNAYGSELLDLPMAFRTEFWNSTGWTLNSADVCTGDTTLAAGTLNAVSLTLSGMTCVWDALPAPGLSNTGCATTAPAGRKYLEGATPTIGFAGDFNLWLKKSGTSGTVTVTPTVPTWLGPVPSARATFGIYKTPIIYMRENY